MVWLVCGTVILAAALAGNLLGAHGLPPEHRPQLSRLLILLANLFCLYAAVGGLAWLVSSSSDRRGRAITILFLMLLSLFLLNYLVWCLRNNYTFFGDTTLAQFWHPLEKIAFLSPLHYHRPVNVLGTGAWPWRDMGVLLASGGAMWLTGGTVFARRDIYVLFDFLWSRWDSLQLHSGFPLPFGRVRVSGGVEGMNVKVPNISAAFPLNPTLSPDCGGEGENLGHLWTLPATVCSIQRTG